MNVILLPLLFLGSTGTPWTIDHPRPGISVLRDETGAWGGFSMGVTHQNRPTYQARKRLDLSVLPRGALQRAKAARLRVFLAVQDYSWNIGDKKHNGLNESFEIVVNGHPLVVATSDPRLPSRSEPSQPLRAGWVDFDIPLQWLDAQRVDVIIRKRPGGKNDDYIYPGIDNSVQHGNSAFTVDGGKTWHSDRLNTINAHGEFMVRLVLAETDLHGSVLWQLPDTVRDPWSWIAYRGRAGNVLRLEPNTNALDRSRAMTAGVTFQGNAPTVRWLDLQEKPLDTKTHRVEDATLQSVLPGGRTELGALEIVTVSGCKVRSIQIDYQQPATAPRPVVDLRPEIAPTRGKRRMLDPVCTIEGDRAILDNGAIRATFQLRPKLALRALHVAQLDRNILVRPEKTHLFRIKVNDKVYGCRDAKVLAVQPTATGFSATLELSRPELQAELTVLAEQDELRLKLAVTNIGQRAVKFHVAFPHVAGLQLSDDSRSDYYLFPWGGGVIANVNTTLRTAYGENTCWWQMIDLFSPSRGGGLYLRSDDPTGRFKCPSLRKGDNLHGDYSLDETGRGFLAPEMMWHDALQPDSGLGITFDYLRFERTPDARIQLPDGCLGAHAGDWRAAMRVYSDWAKRTWPPRPYPSRLSRCWQIAGAGWGNSPLFKNGAYRTDYIIPRNDVVELMSWWSWSRRGPWNTPMDRLKEELGDALYKRYQAYWVKEPVTGKLMYPLNRGDYDGYMPLWGGLPALRAHVNAIRHAGLVPMLYTDPILACATTKLGSQSGMSYGIMNPLWKDAYETGKTPEGYVGSYASYNMCLDTEWYSQWVAKTIARVCRETGADGVRLDEYGHRGYVCHSDKHKHIFAEPGHNAWLQALARNVHQIHVAMDEVRDGLLLTTEFPGHDYMAASLEGAIVYDVRRTSPVRPTPINLFRFYFPECKVFEINRPARPNAHAWMLWNAAGAFSAFYPKAVHAMLQENTDAFERPDNMPLVPTLIPRVYANRFGGETKTILTIHNATGHAIDAPVIAATVDPSYHFVDLLSGRELTPVTFHGKPAITLQMPRNTTVVVARLPKLLRIRAGKVLLSHPIDDATVVACAADGTQLDTLKAGSRLGPTPTKPRPTIIKLFSGGQLRDAIAWPEL